MNGKCFKGAIFALISALLVGGFVGSAAGQTTALVYHNSLWGYDVIVMGDLAGHYTYTGVNMNATTSSYDVYGEDVNYLGRIVDKMNITVHYFFNPGSVGYISLWMNIKNKTNTLIPFDVSLIFGGSSDYRIWSRVGNSGHLQYSTTLRDTTVKVDIESMLEDACNSLSLPYNRDNFKFDVVNMSQVFVDAGISVSGDDGVLRSKYKLASISTGGFVTGDLCYIEDIIIGSKSSNEGNSGGNINGPVTVTTMVVAAGSVSIITVFLKKRKGRVHH